jgi:AraC-type DNA-binding domain-containing proteins
MLSPTSVYLFIFDINRSRMGKSKSLPVYTIKSFQHKSISLHFEIALLEENVERLSFASDPHRHDCFFLMFITKGAGEHIIDTVTYNIKPFSMFLMLPGQVHSWSFSDDIGGFYLYFTLDFYKMYVRERHLEKFPYLRMFALDTYTQFDPARHEVLKNILQSMYEEFTARLAGWEDVLRNALDIILIHIARLSSTQWKIRGTLKTTARIITLQTLIEKHFVEDKQPSSYASRLNVTPKQLNEQCKAALNKTVTELIHERTVLEAKRYLYYTDKSIKQISIATGFNDISYFMRFFKKLTGQTPEQFRKSFSLARPSEGRYLI